MDQIRKFGEQTPRILEFKPEGMSMAISPTGLPVKLTTVF